MFEHYCYCKSTCFTVGYATVGYAIVLLLLFSPISAFAQFDEIKGFSGKTKAIESCAGFPTHQEIGELFDSYAKNNPEFIRSVSIGNSVDGREIWGLFISSDPYIESAEPEIRVIGTIHGNECMSVNAVLAIIELIVDGYGKDPTINDLVDGTEMFFVPLINPDGYSYTTAQRANANGVDLNRNLGFGWVYAGDYPFSEPETKALRDFSQLNSYTLGLSYHTVTTKNITVNSAWNYTPNHPKDETLIEKIGNAYSFDLENYLVVFGWDWFSITGDVNDWSLGTEGTFDWTIELQSDSKLNWEDHSLGIVDFFSWSLKGIEGIVTDSETGLPLFARILIHPEGEPVFTDPDIGDYHRIVMPGTYDVTVFANGYEPLTANNVLVPEFGTVFQDFELVPSDTNFYAIAINQMTMAHKISHTPYQFIDYENKTIPSDVLGSVDEQFYSLSVKGSITVDMGSTFLVGNKNGSDLKIVSGTQSTDPVKILVSDNQDGPFVEIANGTGNINADIDSCDFDNIRFVRIVDVGNANFNNEFSGYDLDAVINLSPQVVLDTNASIDAGIDASTDADDISENTAHETIDAGIAEKPYLSPGSSCGCNLHSKQHNTYSIILVFFYSYLL